jgi:hypothetical protein
MATRRNLALAPGREIQARSGPPPRALLYELLTNGFSRFHEAMAQSSEKRELHKRLQDEFRAMGTIAALVKGIIMNFASRLHNYGGFFYEIEGQYHVAYGFYAYGSLVALASFFMLTAILMSLINLIAVNLVTKDQVPFYVREAKVTIKLPFLALVYGIVVWHLALGVLMFYMISVWFGVFFWVTCSAALCVVFEKYAEVITAVDGCWRDMPNGIAGSSARSGYSNLAVEYSDMYMDSHPVVTNDAMRKPKAYQPEKSQRACQSCFYPGRDTCTIPMF